MTIGLNSSGNPLTRVRVAKHFPLPSLAKQSFKEECDINNIMRKYQKAGIVDHLNKHNGQYGDYIGFEDYHKSLNKILAAQESFSALPSDVRAEFDNDPAKFLSFAQDPENLPQMREMGLAHPESPTPPPEAAPIPTPPTPPATGEVPAAAPAAPPTTAPAG